MDKARDFIKGIQDFINQNSDRASVIFAFSMVETMIDDIVKIKMKHSQSYKGLSAAVKINILHELDQLSELQYESINWLRKQRNNAAHQPGYIVPKSEIQSRWVMEGFKEEERLNTYLITVIGTLWNQHPELRQ